MPQVSVIIITYNRAALIGRAIDSILAQDYKDFEIIIIDDASTDNTEKVVFGYTADRSNIRYFRNEYHQDIPKSRNKGVSLSGGSYIAMLDSDDWWLDQRKLSRQVEMLESDPSLGLVGTGITLFDENGNRLKDDIFAPEDKMIRKKILAKNQVAQSSVLFRKDVFTAIGGYDESLDVCEDLDLWLKIGKMSRLANIPEPLTAYLTNSQGASRLKKKKLIKKTDELVEKYKFDYPGYLFAKIKSWLRMIKG